MTYLAYSHYVPYLDSYKNLQGPKKLTASLAEIELHRLFNISLAAARGRFRGGAAGVKSLIKEESDPPPL